MLQVIMTLAILGVVLYLFNLLVPMDGKIKQVIYVIVCLCIFLWLLGVLGGAWGGGSLHLR
jgi:hypothetical protein